MLIETIALGITFAQAWKANDLDNKSLNTLKKAYDTHANAIALFERHKQNEPICFGLSANQEN